MAVNKIANKPSKSHAGLRNVIEYVLRDNKTTPELTTVYGPFDKEKINYDTVYQSFIEEKKLWKKDTGRMYSHNIISFHKDENITAEQALDFAIDFTQNWYKDYQALIAVHTDRDHIHAHIIINTVSFVDGRKLHTSKNDLDAMKQYTNNMCIKRGLSVPEKGKDFYGNDKDSKDKNIWNKNLYQLITNNSSKSYLYDCMTKIQEACKTAESQEEFINLMNQKGWQVEWSNRKHIVFKNTEGKKVRDSNISKKFDTTINKEELLTKFEENKKISYSCTTHAHKASHHLKH